jgi:hypothetical protein
LIYEINEFNFSVDSKKKVFFLPVILGTPKKIDKYNLDPTSWGLKYFYLKKFFAKEAIKFITQCGMLKNDFRKFGDKINSMILEYTFNLKISIISGIIKSIKSLPKNKMKSETDFNQIIIKNIKK